MQAREPLDTLVVGAGISGLVFARERVRAGREVLVLEAAARPGGLVRTHEHDGFRFEDGPEALPGNARTIRALCQELGLAVHESPRGEQALPLARRQAARDPGLARGPRHEPRAHL